jgi:hypothetical protein
MSFLAFAARQQSLRMSTFGTSVMSPIGLSGQRAFSAATSIPRHLPLAKRTFALGSAPARTSLFAGQPNQPMRSFSTSRLLSLRESYFQRPVKSRSAYSSGGGGGQSWWRNFRRRLDNLPPMYVVYGLIGINVAIYGLWQYAQTSWRRFKDPSLYYWMSRNFIVSEANFAAGRM